MLEWYWEVSIWLGCGLLGYSTVIFKYWWGGINITVNDLKYGGSILLGPIIMIIICIMFVDGLFNTHSHKVIFKGRKHDK